MTDMNDHLMVEDLMPWDHLALDNGPGESSGSRPSPNGWRPDANGRDHSATQEHLRRLTKANGSRQT